MTLKARILVVDDEPGILRFLRAALVANDFEFESARSVQETIKSIASHVPDVVVLDLGLPDGDGMDVIRQVREWSDVPIIVVSARDREAEKIEALDLGTDDFVAEPFSVGELMTRIRVALRNALVHFAAKAATKMIPIVFGIGSRASQSENKQLGPRGYE
jgi:two-component system, OmpR family, KDP operon response regulator KdpE